MPTSRKTVAAALGLALLGGCSRSIVITNISDQQMTLRQAAPGGEVSYTLDPGGQVAFPAETSIKIQDQFRIEYR